MGGFYWSTFTESNSPVKPDAFGLQCVVIATTYLHHKKLWNNFFFSQSRQQTWQHTISAAGKKANLYREIQRYWTGIVLSRWLSFLVTVQLLIHVTSITSELFGCWKQHIAKCFYGIEIVQHHRCPPLAAQLHWLVVQVGTQFRVGTCCSKQGWTAPRGHYQAASWCLSVRK